MPGLINIILFILVFHTHQGGANENQEPNKFFSQINTNMHKTLIKLMQFAILTDIKRLCIFGQKALYKSTIIIIFIIVVVVI